jgi:hypothetical protein
MCQPVIPVPKKISAQQQYDPQQDAGLNMEQSKVLLQIIVYKKEQTGYPYIQQPLCNAYTDVGNGVMQVENGLLFLAGNEKLQCHEHNKKRYCQRKQV